MLRVVWTLLKLMKRARRSIAVVEAVEVAAKVVAKVTAVVSAVVVTAVAYVTVKIKVAK